MYIVFFFFFTDTFKTLSKSFCCMKTYLQVTIQNHWTVPLNPPPPLFNFFPSQERYLFTQCRRLLEKFCATNSVKKIPVVWLWDGQSPEWCLRFPCRRWHISDIWRKCRQTVLQRIGADHICSESKSVVEVRCPNLWLFLIKIFPLYITIQTHERIYTHNFHIAARPPTLCYTHW